jgi:hypothetical protein
MATLNITIVSIMRQLFLCSLIIRGSLILKPRPLVTGPNERLIICFLSFGSEMDLPENKLGYLLNNRPAGTGNKMWRHARMVLIRRHRTI